MQLYFLMIEETGVSSENTYLPLIDYIYNLNGYL